MQPHYDDKLVCMEEELSAGNMIISWEMFKPKSPPNSSFLAAKNNELFR